MYYETIFIVNPDISQENTEALTDDLVSKVEKVGGRIVKRENWGSRPLAYSIANRKRGNYILLVTDGSPEAFKTLEHAISLEERIIRSLTTRLTELSDKPSPLLRRAQASAKREEEAAEAKAAADAAPATEDVATEKVATEKTAPEEAAPEEAAPEEAATEEATPVAEAKAGAKDDSGAEASA
ncbi:MAG: 30S ribosomal protein S6 [Mariprofundus sp.]|nr:30S ribosomal protein S6 [Mariprofundus sp.]